MVLILVCNDAYGEKNGESTFIFSSNRWWLPVQILDDKLSDHLNRLATAQLQQQHYNLLENWIIFHGDYQV